MIQMYPLVSISKVVECTDPDRPQLNIYPAERDTNLWLYKRYVCHRVLQILKKEQHMIFRTCIVMPDESLTPWQTTEVKNSRNLTLQ